MRRFLMFAVPLSLIVVSLAVSDSNAVSKNQVMKDFKANFTQAPGRKVQSMEYVGKPRSFLHPEGLVKVPYKAYQVKFVDLFEACGLKVEYLFEVWYRKDSTYVQNVYSSHKALNEPPPPEALKDEELQKLVRGAWNMGSGNYVAKIQSLKVDKQTGSWEFCNPKYNVEFTIQVLGGDMNEMQHDLYECTSYAKITKVDEKVDVLTNLCKDPKTGNEVQCYYSNHCKNLGKRSAVQPLAWGEVAEKIFKKGICEATSDGRTGRSNCNISSIKLVKEGAYDEKTKQKTMRVEVVSEYYEKNAFRKSGDEWNYETKYQCILEAPVAFNIAYADKWAFRNISWCAKADGDCDLQMDSTHLGSVCKCLSPDAYCKRQTEALNERKGSR